MLGSPFSLLTLLISARGVISLSIGDGVRVIASVRTRGENTKGWLGTIAGLVERDETEWGVWAIGAQCHTSHTLELIRSAVPPY
jgi:hypothetical protein